MNILIAALLAPPTVLAVILLVNRITFPRLGRAPGRRPSVDWPSVSILVPARDEAGGIDATLSGLLAMDYPGRLEVLVLDDQSQDATAQIVQAHAAADARLRLLDGRPLPSGWAGKNWACHQLAGQAAGEILVFTDADVAWSTPALARVIAYLDQLQADMFTVWPTQITHSWGERLTAPMMMFTVLCYLPEILVRRTSIAAFSAASGQCLVFRRSAYERLGGHAGVKGSVLEDMHLASACKRHGLRLAMALGDGLVRTRMYHNWQETRHGFAKNILAGHGNSPILLFFSAVFHWTFFLTPFVWLGVGWVHPAARSGWPQIPAAMIALAWSLRALSAAISKERVRDAFLLPVTTLLFTVIAWQSVWWRYRWGGPSWKGRRIPARETPVREITLPEKPLRENHDG